MRHCTLRVVTSAFTGHRAGSQRRGKTVSIQFPQSIDKENQQNYFSNTTVIVLFGNKFTKAMSQHVGSECNGTHLIQCRRVNYANRVCRNQNYFFFPAIKAWRDRLPNTVDFNASEMRAFGNS